MARPRKRTPEMLLVSFCDILTISISGLFMATIITVFEAVKIPEFRPTPRTVPTHKRPVFFECRDNQLFFIDKDLLDAKVEARLSGLSAEVRGGALGPFLKEIGGEEIGNRHYAVDLKFLLVKIMALEPRAGVPGESLDQLSQPMRLFRLALDRLDPAERYIAFLVRDDSFPLFREARRVADEQAFDSGWELLAEDEPIRFGQAGAAIAPQ